jgi:hypothetical protein
VKNKKRGVIKPITGVNIVLIETLIKRNTATYSKNKYKKYSREIKNKTPSQSPLLNNLS